MATPVQGGLLDFTVSGTTAPMANADSIRIRTGGGGALDAGFSSLLRGQLQNGASTFSTLPRNAVDPAPARPSSATRESVPNRAAPPTLDARDDLPPSRDATRSGKDGHAPAAGRDDASPDARPTGTDQAENGTRETPPGVAASTDPGSDGDAEAALDESRTPPAGDVGIVPEPTATIAALAGGIAAGTSSGEGADADAADDGGAESGGIVNDAGGAGTGRARGDAVEGDAARDASAGHFRKLSPPAAAASDPGIADTAGKGGAQISFSSATTGAALARHADLLAARTETRAATATPSPASEAATPLLNALRAPAQASAAMPQFSIPTGAGQRAWAEEVGNRVMWMLGRAESRAELVLTPPHLGKVEVSINLNGDQTTAQFVASSQAARDALEQAMPRLRELLSQAGIHLGDASVGTSAEDKTPDGGQAHGHGGKRAAAHGAEKGGGETPAAAVAVSNWVSADSGRINTFA
ncbi:MAG: flagellar hook-length control protein FliK [Azoarcus sp.]|jgi:flagellar hook-length control protein FliK|nr:flagellar hook-length control protein FliK [Azoarcus sp.]